ncbi:MAG TPA: winged helix-turn-helix domain-containing protein, partial [Acetobacteraceae bacterium]|nr:winged helix-turn-helix domain-containing protein [Acetobacteraceae bacterium]
MLAEAITWRFDDFLLDVRTRALFRLNGEHAPALVPLGSRAFDILSVLMDHRGALVSRQEIMDAVWPNIAVEDNNLTVQIAALRHALDAGRTNGSCIQTIPGRGYRFLPDVTPSDQWPPDRSSDDAGVNNTTTVGGANAETTESAGPEMANTPAAPRPAIESDKEDRRPATTGIAGVPAQWRRRRGKIAASAVCLILLVASLAWFAVGMSWLRSAPVVALAPPAVPDKPHAVPAVALARTAPPPADHWRVPIAVLSFTRSGDGVNEQTADSVADSLAIDLSQFPGIRVIARQATLTHKDRPIDIQRIGQDLGVRYAVDGSVRASEGILHVSAQLLSTKTGEEVWAERFDIGRQGDSRSMED